MATNIVAIIEGKIRATKEPEKKCKVIRFKFDLSQVISIVKFKMEMHYSSPKSFFDYWILHLTNHMFCKNFTFAQQ